VRECIAITPRVSLLLQELTQLICKERSDVVDYE
jgi:hypothetical protein